MYYVINLFLSKKKALLRDTSSTILLILARIK